jgi:tetratricopeptide (TPR) repeat protein
MILRSFALICTTCLVVHGAWAQDGKAFFKEAEKLRAAGQLDGALEQYGLAIDVSPDYVKAYQGRAAVYLALGRNKERADDLKKVVELQPKDPQALQAAAEAELDNGDAAAAVGYCDRALAINPKAMAALQTKVRACLALGRVDDAVSAADAALALKATTDTYYLHGLTRMAVGDHAKAAADFDQVLAWNHLFEPAYVALGEAQLHLSDSYRGTAMQMRALEKGITTTTLGLQLNPQSTELLLVRSKLYARQKEYGKAIDDVSKCVALGREDTVVYYQRALYYHGFGQHQNAVNDLNKVLLTDPRNVRFLLLRAECREANLDLNGAIKDLKLAEKIMSETEGWTAAHKEAIAASRDRVQKQAFELDRESDPPTITVIEPFRKGDVAQVSSALTQVKVSGYVRDKSLLREIRVQGVQADYDKEEKDPEFRVVVPLKADQEQIVVEAIDVYDNIATTTLTVQRTEGTPPVIALQRPVVGPDRVITVDAGREDLFIEGRASDASGIRSITVDGLMASFIPDTTATEFSIKVPIKDRERFTIRAEDRFGNATEYIGTIARRTAPAVASSIVTPTDKPASTTGITWVVFIENTDYRNFPALQGPTNDVSKMQRSFANYSIQRTITKRNLTKQQLERFFNIELRDMVRNAGVNTVLVWYAGHGRNVGGKTYWIPVDARKDDIYSYYNYSSLKSLMENYSESVKSTLVVSDAVGSDPSFYELTR